MVRLACTARHDRTADRFLHLNTLTSLDPHFSSLTSPDSQQPISASLHADVSKPVTADSYISTHWRLQNRSSRFQHLRTLTSPDKKQSIPGSQHADVSRQAATSTLEAEPTHAAAQVTTLVDKPTNTSRVKVWHFKFTLLSLSPLLSLCYITLIIKSLRDRHICMSLQLQNGNEGVLHTDPVLQNWSFNIRCSFASYPRHLFVLGGGCFFTLLQWIQSAYCKPHRQSRKTFNWIKHTFIVLKKFSTEERKKERNWDRQIATNIEKKKERKK